MILSVMDAEGLYTMNRISTLSLLEQHEGYIGVMSLSNHHFDSIDIQTARGQARSAGK